MIDAGIPDPGPVGSRSGTGPLLTKTLLMVGQGGRVSRLTTNESKPVPLAVDKSDGSVIGEVELPGFPLGTPMTCMHNGRRYISVAVSDQEGQSLIGHALPKEGASASGSD